MSRMVRVRALMVLGYVSAAIGVASWPIVPDDVLISGEEGYPCYRIPSMVRMSNDSIALFAEGRKTCADMGWNDIVYKETTCDTKAYVEVLIHHQKNHR